MAAELRRATLCPRRKDARFGVILQIHVSGERLPTVVDHATGLPAVLPLRYALSRRRAGAHTTLSQKLRRIAELYGWYAARGRNLDSHLMAGGLLDTNELALALGEVDARADPAVSGALHATALGGLRTGPIRNVSMHNRRCSAWAAFGRWVTVAERWRSGAHPGVHDVEARRRDALITRLTDWYEDEVQPEGTSAWRLGLSDREMEALLGCVRPDARGAFPNVGFSERTVRRAWLMFGLAYYGGLRLGELLNLHIEDVPRRSEGEWAVRVVRRPDDPGDVRPDAPAVKRGGRTVDLPEELYDDLRVYIDRHRPRSPHPDLFVTREGEPLSYWRAVAMGKQLRVYAARAYERSSSTAHAATASGHRVAEHSLGTFTWHRLRHTRARELLPRFVDVRNRRAGDAEAFCAHFGWARLESARPYIAELQDELTSEIAAEALSAEGERYPLRRR